MTQVPSAKPKPRRVKPQLGSSKALNHPNGTSGNLGNHYVSTCKLCPLGVFDYQPKVWLTKPMGWSHQDCAERAGHV